MAQKTATRLGREPNISNSSFSHEQAYNILCLLKEYGNIYVTASSGSWMKRKKKKGEIEISFLQELGSNLMIASVRIGS